MTKPIREFKPTHYMDITSSISLQIEVVVENGECFVYASFYDGLNKTFDRVTKSRARNNAYGNSYFVKANQRYYLSDFMQKSPF